MTDLSLFCDVSQTQTSFYDHSYDNLRSVSHFEQVSTETYYFDNSSEELNGSQFVPSLYQSLEPTQLFLQYYIEVPQVTATEFGGTTYYQYAYFYYPLYSTIPHSYASDDNVSTTVSSSTSYFEYSENISHSMELNSYTNTTEISYTDVQFSSSLYESNPPQNNTQIYADNYYYDPNVEISGVSEFDNLTTAYNSSGLSGDSSSLEAPNIQNEIDPRDQLKFLKDRLYIIALSGKLRLKDSVPVVDVLPTIEEDINLIEDDENAQIPVEELEMEEHNSLPLEQDESFNSIYEKPASYEKRDIISETKNITFKNDGSKSKFQDDKEIKVVDWTIEVEDETCIETYDVDETLNDDNDIKVLDWTIELEEDDCKQEYDDNFVKTEISSSSHEIDEYDSKKVTEYHKEQLYIWALSGYMNLKDEVPIVHILPVIEEETSFLEDDRGSDLADEINNEQPPNLLGSSEILDLVIEEHNSNDSFEDFVMTDLEASIEKTKHDETGCSFNAVKSTRELSSYINKDCAKFKSAESSVEIDLINSSKGDYDNKKISKEIEEHENKDPYNSVFYDVDLHHSDIGFNQESTTENKEKNPRKIKKKRFERIRNWFSNLWCCWRNKPT